MLKYYQFKAVELHDELLNSQEKLEKILKVRPSLSLSHTLQDPVQPLSTVWLTTRTPAPSYTQQTVKKFEEQTPEGDPWHHYVASIIEKARWPSPLFYYLFLIRTTINKATTNGPTAPWNVTNFMNDTVPQGVF